MSKKQRLFWTAAVKVQMTLPWVIIIAGFVGLVIYQMQPW